MKRYSLGIKYELLQISDENGPSQTLSLGCCYLWLSSLEQKFITQK